MTTETEFVDAITIIASNLNIAAERVFEIFVDAQMMLGIIDIVSIFVCIAGGYIITRYTYKMYEDGCTDKKEECRCDDDRDSMLCILTTVFLLAVFAMWIVVLPLGDAVMKIVCPEYSAMREIIGLVIK